MSVRDETAETTSFFLYLNHYVTIRSPSLVLQIVSMGLIAVFSNPEMSLNDGRRI